MKQQIYENIALWCDGSSVLLSLPCIFAASDLFSCVVKHCVHTDARKNKLRRRSLSVPKRHVTVSRRTSRDLAVAVYFAGGSLKTGLVMHYI